MSALAVLCQAAIEQAVMAAESPPHQLGTKQAYHAVSREMLRQSILAAIEAGITSEGVTRIVAEALVSVGRPLTAASDGATPARRRDA